MLYFTFLQILIFFRLTLLTRLKMSNIVPSLARKYFRGMPFNMMFDMYSALHFFLQNKVLSWLVAYQAAVITLSPAPGISFPGNPSSLRYSRIIKRFWSLCRLSWLLKQGAILVLKLLFWGLFFYIIGFTPKTIPRSTFPTPLLHQ